VARKPTLLAQLITDKLAHDPVINEYFEEFISEEISRLVDVILKHRDKIAGERSSYNRGMSDTQPNWGRKRG